MKEMKEKMELERSAPETFNPFLRMRRFTKDMERLFDLPGFMFPRLFRTDLAPLPAEFEAFEWVPQIEVLQKNGQFMVRADLPGLTKDDIKVEVTEEFLMLSGERKEAKEEKREDFYRTERNYGTFFRQVPLPEGANAEKAVATFLNGVLEITMPAAQVEKPIRKLEIKEPVAEKAAKATA